MQIRKVTSFDAFKRIKLQDNAFGSIPRDLKRKEYVKRTSATKSHTRVYNVRSSARATSVSRNYSRRKAGPKKSRSTSPTAIAITTGGSSALFLVKELARNSDRRRYCHHCRRYRCCRCESKGFYTATRATVSKETARGRKR